MTNTFVVILSSFLTIGCLNQYASEANLFAIAFEKQFQFISKNHEIQLKLHEFDSVYLNRGLESVIYFTDYDSSIYDSKRIDQRKISELQTDIDRLNESFFYQPDKQFKLEVLTSRPIMINESTFIIFAQFNYQKGGSESFYLIEKEDTNWQLKKRFNYIEY